MLIPLVHGEPIRFGADGERGVVQRSDGRLEIVDVAEVGRGRAAGPRRGAARTRAWPSRSPGWPPARTSRRPIGVFRAVERPEYGEEMSRQIVRAQEQRGVGDLAALLRSGSTWTVD